MAASPPACSGPCRCPTFREHLRGVTVGLPSDTPTRRGGAHAKATGETEARWDRDGEAYKRLRADGLSPNEIDGCADVEATADHAWQIEPEKALETL